MGWSLVRGGEELAKDDDLGYSSIRALTPHQVSRFDQFLRHLLIALDIYAKPRGREKAGAGGEVVHLLESFDALQSLFSHGKGTAARSFI